MAPTKYIPKMKKYERKQQVHILIINYLNSISVIRLHVISGTSVYNFPPVRVWISILGLSLLPESCMKINDDLWVTYLNL